MISICSSTCAVKSTLISHLVAHPNGAVTPAEEPANLAARADHFAAKGYALNAAIASGLPIAPVAAAAPLVSGKTYKDPNLVLNLNDDNRDSRTYSMIIF